MATEENDEEKGKRQVRSSHLQWVPLSKLIPSPSAQREFKPSWANALAADFNLEGMGFPVVSHRGEHFYIVDGQHRIAALRILGFSDDDMIQCEVYEGLTDEQEADLFLERNHQKTVGALDTFRVALKANHDRETQIDQVVRAQGLHIAKHRTPGAVSAVTTLRKVVDRQGYIGLGRVLRVIRDAYGDPGMEAPVIDAISLCLHRYDGNIDDAALTERLANTNGGLNGLLQPAEKTHLSLGQPRVQCIAATAALIYNRAQRGKKLPPWWAE